jgi:AraC family transcriptional regulator
LPPSNLHSLSGKLTFIPAGTRFRAWQKPRALAQTTYLYIDPNGPVFSSSPKLAAAEFRPRLYFSDADLWATATKLKARIGGQDSDDDYAQSLGSVLCHELTRLGAVAPRTSDLHGPGGLANWQRKRVQEYIAAHVSEQISLPTMADLTRLSPCHFARAFKLSFGMPPHRYHTMCRIGEAKALLANPEFSVTHIGMRLGFGQTSAFTASFRKLTGASPTEYRRSLE